MEGLQLHNLAGIVGGPGFRLVFVDFFPAGGVDESILAAAGAAGGRTWRQFRELAGPDPRFGSALEFPVRPGTLNECVPASLGWLNETYVWTL